MIKSTPRTFQSTTQAGDSRIERYAQEIEREHRRLFNDASPTRDVFEKRASQNLPGNVPTKKSSAKTKKNPSVERLSIPETRGAERGDQVFSENLSPTATISDGITRWKDQLRKVNKGLAENSIQALDQADNGTLLVKLVAARNLAPVRHLVR